MNTTENPSATIPRGPIRHGWCLSAERPESVEVMSTPEAVGRAGRPRRQAARARSWAREWVFH